MKKPPTPAQLLEREITKQIKGFMAWRLWRPVRMQRTVIPNTFQTGEPGMPDFLFIRYLRTGFTGLAVTCWVEMKRAKRGKLAEDQIKWRDTELLRGAIVLKANDLREFEQEYERLFGWLRTEQWVHGQQQISFDPLNNSDKPLLTNDLDALTNSSPEGVT